MVAKRTIKTDVKRTFLNKYWWAALLIVVFVGVGANFGYNKYLDRQNIADMEQLLADFEQLKKDVEYDTGEKLYIEATCGSVGKFATSYACTITLKPTDLTSDINLTDSYAKNGSKFMNDIGCILASKGYKLTSNDGDYYICSGFHIRPSNEAKAEEIFYEYDTSPGSPV